MDQSPAPSDDARKLTGLSSFPQIVDRAAFQASLKRHHPGRTGAVLLNVDIDENGFVTDVEEAPRRPQNRPHAVLVERLPNGKTVERPLVVRHDPGVVAAAREVLREVRFKAAERNGEPAAFRLRMTLKFE
jgi:hypothetical protein